MESQCTQQRVLSGEGDGLPLSFLEAFNEEVERKQAFHVCRLVTCFLCLSCCLLLFSVI